MIDVHCHLEQKDFDKDRQMLIDKLRGKLNAVITCCANPTDFEKTIAIVKNNTGFVFATAGLHPEYVEINEEEMQNFIEKIRENKTWLVGIGEIGLDYYWVKDERLREKQALIFRIFIDLARKLKMPVVIHARDAFEDAIKILEEENAKQVLMHMFGARHLLQKVISNGWFISLNTIVLRSKKHKKIARDISLENLMLETDSPWLHPDGGKKRNTPLSIEIVAKKIAEIKKIDVQEVIRATDKNAVSFFGLRIR